MPLLPPMLRRAFAFAAVTLLALAPAAAAVEVRPAVTVSLTVTGDGPSTRVLGDLVAYDDDSLTLDVEGERRTFAWADLTSQSAFIARYRLVDEDDARGWLSLGAFGRAVGADRQAEQALQTATRLDPSLAAEADRIRGLPADTLRRPPATRPAEQDHTGDDDQAATATPPPMPRVGPRAAPGQPAGGATKFQAVGNGEAMAAVDQARRDAEQSLRRLGIPMREIQTPHFLIFTDWDPVDDAFLADSVEQAYRLVTREFDIPYEQNVFIGKLPIYMFDAHDGFLRYAREIDGQDNFTKSVAGYYRGTSNGMGKMAMSKPRSTADAGLDKARKLWARTLTHEFTHAFFARYRSNAFVPRWLNEGLAEVIAEQVYPREGATEIARAIARSDKSIEDLFDDDVLPPGEFYPVAMTLVQALYREDSRKFGQYVDRIKAGDDPQTAMVNLYGVDYEGLAAAWRRMMLRQ